MRVLHLSWEYPPLVYGGLGRHVHALAEAQAAAGHDVVVVTQHPGAPDVRADECVGGVRVVRVAHPSGRVATEAGDGFLAWVRALDDAMADGVARLARAWRPDVVHAHDWVVGDAAELLATYAPVVATVHATEAGRHQGWVTGDLSVAVHAAEWRLVALARRVIVCSRHMRGEVTRLFEPGAVDVIPNGVDVAAWTTTPQQVAEARAEVPGDGPLVVVAGRLEWEKGMHTLLESMPRLRRRVPGVRLAVVGRGSQREALAALARERRVSRSVHLLGWLTDARLRATIGAADVAVVPSVYEPFGLVALEAMAVGAPLVVSAAGGLAEVVRDRETGLVVPPLDPPALADAVTELLRDRVLARRLAGAAHESVAREHTWAAVAAATVATYEEALREAPRTHADPVPPPGRREGRLLHDVP